METKRLILSISIMMLLVFSWQIAVRQMYTKHPEWAPADQSATPTTAPTATATQSTAVAQGAAPTTSAVVSSSAGGLRAVGDVRANSADIGSPAHGDPTYNVGLAINPAGAGISSVTLNEFFETAEQKSLYIFQKPIEGFEPTTSSLASRSVTINGSAVDLASLIWTRVSTNAATATYRATINDGEKPQLQIDKTFELYPRDTADGRNGYEIRFEQDFKNLTNKPITVHAAFNGPNLPARENDRSEDRQYIAGYDNGYKEIKIGRAFVSELTKDAPTKDITKLEALPLLWVGAGSSYFNAIVRPDPTTGVQIGTVTARGLNNDLPADQRLGAMTIETNDFQLAPGASSPLNLRVFFGPKKRSVLTNSYYSAFPLGYDKTLVFTGGWCGFLTFSWLVNILYYTLFAFHFVLRDWGLAIIGLVCLVRTLLHPITKKSQVNMMQMGKMGPQIEQLKKKYGDDKDGLNKAMMGIYKEQGMTPILGCLPMLLQTPIWIALWSALQSTFDLRQAGFLRFGALHLTWIKDLSHPDFLMHFDQPFMIPLLGWHVYGINVLPILMAGVFFVQQKMQPQPSGQTPEQIQQRKMMSWMSLLFPVMLYTGPSGLNLYILTSTSLGIIESKIIRDHIKQREEAEKAGRVFIDAKPTRATKRKDKKEPPKQERKSGIMGWIADLQAKAEEVRREAERRGKDRA